MGLEDMYCKVEGSTKNIQMITEAFLRALANQVRLNYILLHSNRLYHRSVPFSKLIDIPSSYHTSKGAARILLF